MQENQSLRSGQTSAKVAAKVTAKVTATLPNGHQAQATPTQGAEGGVTMRSSKGSDRPQSMFEPRDQSRKPNPNFQTVSYSSWYKVKVIHLERWLWYF